MKGRIPDKYVDEFMGVVFAYWRKNDIEKKEQYHISFL